LNKILKDTINRSQQMLGRDADYVPGWDCHGLPIEWKIEEKYRKEGKDKDQVDVVEFRKECREFANHWISVQREEFKRMGVIGNWDKPYLTMTFKAEAQIAAELGKFLMNGSLYKGAKPVMWSVVEKTALAEAEVEYHDHRSPTIFVRFAVASSPVAALSGASVVIWTTTPWTIPANRAVAFGPDIDYVAFKVKSVADESAAKVGESIIIAKELVESVCTESGIAAHEIIAEFKGSELAGTICHHPMRSDDVVFEFDVPMLSANFVEVDTGSGFVHIAPSHGADDWELGIANGIAVPDTVGPDGSYLPAVGEKLTGTKVMDFDPTNKKSKPWFPANKAVLAMLTENGSLLASGAIEHSYPHSWRSKAPLIFRNTPQWFISMEKTGLRETALKAIDDTHFVPAQGKNRLRAMIEQRPDWCVSRQRAWGVPITVFVDKKTGEPLRDQGVLDRVYKIFCEEGSDAWFARPASDFLGPDYNADDYEQVKDILDVWFDSGSTHAFVLEGDEWPNLSTPASLYLEGSDQHRGWFHSSLLESCGTRGRAPYDAILTHGFILDEKAEKMSKSSGNALSPNDVYAQFGADILRLWVVGTDYTEDPVFGPETLKQMSDIYRRLRNTLRFLLGNLDGFTDDEKIDVAQMPELERWMLNRLHKMDTMVRKSCDAYHFHPLFNELSNFCTVDLSAFYFDIRKDTLYCERPDSTLRRATRTVLNETFNYLTAWLAPFICFTAEEAWQARFPSETDSVHFRLFPDAPESWKDEELEQKWKKVRALRRVVTGALEIERAEKRIGSSLQAAPKVYVASEYITALQGVNLSELVITSGGELIEGEAPVGAFKLDDVEGVGVVPALAEGEKCERCWMVSSSVGANAAHPTVCSRCGDAVDHLGDGGA
ncbi:MAG: isoleucine--tRNA ligase, partial [Rhodospirillaceae bacterium]|nr:isoleucine--tRNA ligase [Rhodospirillaceae bacterium]